jgi:curved DNA-binding protein CbpA
MRDQRLRNFYQMFGLKESASDPEIEKAYRRLVEKIRMHVNAPEILKQYNMIYEVLKRPLVRKRYDILLAAQKRGEEVVELNWAQVLRDPGIVDASIEEKPGRKELTFWKKWTSQQKLGFLAALIVIFVLSFFLFVFPRFRHTFVSLNQDDPLYDRYNGTYFGKIVKRENKHEFPNGAVADAYLIELASHTERWYPAIDIRKSFRKKPLKLKE